MSHHAYDPKQEQELSEAMKRVFGEFPDGRLNAEDAGAIPVAIGHEDGRVTLRFPKNLNWIGFTADEAIDIAETLIKHARACGSKKPLTLKIG